MFDIAGLAKRLRFRLAFIIAIASIASALSYSRILDNYEFELLDARFLLRGHRAASGDIVLIEIGDDTIAKLEAWPIDRRYYAMMVKALAGVGAKAILFDIILTDETARDGELEDAIKTAGNVYLPFVFDIDAEAHSKFVAAKPTTSRLLERFRIASKGAGHINIIPDSDGKGRRVPIYINYKGGLYPYLSFLLACDHLGIRQKEISLAPGRYLLLGKDIRVPLDESSNLIVNFSGTWSDTFRHYSFVDILQSYIAPLSGAKPILDLKAFKDKICVIGLTGTGTVDLHPNPFERLYPGIGVHAEVINSVLKKSFISRASRRVNLGILLALGILIAFFTSRARPVAGLSILVIAVLLFFSLAGALFSALGLWIDLFCPILTALALYLALTLYRYIGERQARQLLEKELEIARTIQESFLPKNLPEIEGLEMARGMFTARRVGGDLYDFLDLGDHRLGIIIGDVSGKGIPASLFMAKVMSELRFLAGVDYRPSNLLSALNSKLVAEASTNLFVTVLYMVFDAGKRNLTFASGGHLPAVVVKGGSGETKWLKTEQGMPLGLVEGEFSESCMELERGDTVVLYTDGVTEAMDGRGQMYGLDRLSGLVRKNRYASAEDLLKIIREDVRRFEADAGQHDDITILVMKVLYS